MVLQLGMTMSWYKILEELPVMSPQQDKADVHNLSDLLRLATVAYSNSYITSYIVYE